MRFNLRCSEDERKMNGRSKRDELEGDQMYNTKSGTVNWRSDPFSFRQIYSVWLEFSLREQRKTLWFEKKSGKSLSFVSSLASDARDSRKRRGFYARKFGKNKLGNSPAIQTKISKIFRKPKPNRLCEFAWWWITDDQFTQLKYLTRFWSESDWTKSVIRVIRLVVVQTGETYLVSAFESKLFWIKAAVLSGFAFKAGENEIAARRVLALRECPADAECASKWRLSVFPKSSVSLAAHTHKLKNQFTINNRSIQKNRFFKDRILNAARSGRRTESAA